MTGRARRQSRQRLPNNLTSRSAGRGQGRRQPARAAREPLTAAAAEAIRTLPVNPDTVDLNYLSGQISTFTAYASGDAKRGRRLLENLARQLEHQHPGAAASLREGLEETLTVMRLGLGENLERVLSSTNLIENLFSRVREIGRRVKRWQSGTMVLRWTAAGVIEAERGFRKLAGYRALPTLIAALRAHAAQLDRSEGKLDTAQDAA